MASSIPNWEDYGDIWWKFYQPKLKVTPKVQKLANKILAKIPKNSKHKEKQAAELLYQWVANNIHYVAVYLNASSSFTPNSPDTILTRGYGDCKDFSTLLVVLLKAANIKADPVAIDWSNQFKKYPLPTPASFNHAIVYIPKWHMFLNPTNLFAPFGTIGTPLTQKPALIIRPNSTIIMTPENSAAKNSAHFRSEVSLLASGELKGNEHIIHHGILSEPVRGELMQTSGDILAQQQLQAVNLIGFGNIKSTPIQNLIKPLKVSGNWNAPNAIYMGDEIDLFVTPPYGMHFFHMNQLSSFVNYGREYPIIIGAKSLIWHQKFNYPSSYRIKYLPDTIKVKNSAGDFEINWQVTGGHQITVTQELKIKHDIYSAKNYLPFAKALLHAIQSEQQMLVLTRKF